MDATGNGTGSGSYAEYVEGMKARTKSFGLRIIKLCRSLPKDFVARAMGGQLLRAGTAVGANYRAACRVRTAREFTAKIRIVMEEADEALYWLELFAAAEILPAKRLGLITREADELVAIVTSAYAKSVRQLKGETRGG